MTTDLWMLVWTGLMCVLIPVVYVGARLSAPGGVAWGFGNRETGIDAPEWSNRAARAHANLVENIAPFAILVLVAHVSGKANATTALGATIFFWARVAHAAVYIAGVPYVRTAAFAASAVGLVMILLELF